MFPYFAIAFIFLALGLVTFNVLKPKWYPFAVYLSGLLMAYSTTLIGQSVVGTDISGELFMSNMALKNGWNLTLLDPSNTSVVVGWFVPQLCNLLNWTSIGWFVTVAPIWIYKAVLPIIFAFTPAILYAMFKGMVGELRAFYAAMFFIIVPIYSVEIATIGKSMVAFTLMALGLWAWFSDWKWGWKTLACCAATILTAWAHYTMGLLLLSFWGILFAWNLLIKRQREKMLSLALIIIPSVLFFSLWYVLVGQGIMVTAIVRMATFFMGMPAQVTFTSLRLANAFDAVRPALGLDISTLSWSGVVFRIVQLITELLVVSGFIWAIVKKKLTEEILACCGWGFILLAACILSPTFGSVINATRMYQVALMFLAPCFVLGMEGLVYYLGKVRAK